MSISVGMADRMDHNERSRFFRRSMKKILVSFLLIVMALCLTLTAFADNELHMFYEAATELLFETQNVTLTGHAEFFLDGERFKTADLRYVQDYTSSLLQYHLLTPRRDGSKEPDRESGYTIIANGEDVYVMEVIYPGVYKTGSTYVQSTILRKSVQTSLIADMIRILADQADTFFGTEAITIQPCETGGKELRIQLGENVPDLVNTALNLVYQFAAKRYFDTDYDQVSEWMMVPMENAMTTVLGILGNTKSLSLKEANVSAIRNDAGDLEQIKGDVSLNLNTGKDGTRQLGISFRLDVSDPDGSHVDAFDPEAYGVKQAGAMDPEEEREYEEAAHKRFRLAGYTVDETMNGSVKIIDDQLEIDEDIIFVDYMNGDGSVHWIYFTDSLGRMLGLQNLTGVWQGTYDERHREQYPDQKLVKETEEKLLSYLAEENPELSADVLSLETDWWYQNGDELYLHFWEGGKPVDHAWDEVDFIVRAAPEWRIEFFSCIGNG